MDCFSMVHSNIYTQFYQYCRHSSFQREYIKSKSLQKSQISHLGSIIQRIISDEYENQQFSLPVNPVVQIDLMSSSFFAYLEL